MVQFGIELGASSHPASGPAAERPYVRWLPAESMASFSTEQFLELESEVWTALVTGDSEADGRLLADEFLGVYGSGFSRREDHVNQLQNGPTVASFDLSQGRIQVLAEDVVLLSYRAEWTPTSPAGEGEKIREFITSIWRRSDEGWRNIFSQDTAVET